VLAQSACGAYVPAPSRKRPLSLFPDLTVASPLNVRHFAEAWEEALTLGCFPFNNFRMESRLHS